MDNGAAGMGNRFHCALRAAVHRSLAGIRASERFRHLRWFGRHTCRQLLNQLKCQHASKRWNVKLLSADQGRENHRWLLDRVDP